MEIYKNVAFEIHVDELAYDMGYTGYAIVYLSVQGRLRLQHLFFGEDHAFTSRGEAELLLKNIAEQYIELEAGAEKEGEATE